MEKDMNKNILTYLDDGISLRPDELKSAQARFMNGCIINILDLKINIRYLRTQLREDVPDPKTPLCSKIIGWLDGFEAECECDVMPNRLDLIAKSCNLIKSQIRELCKKEEEKS